MSFQAIVEAVLSRAVSSVTSRRTTSAMSPVIVYVGASAALCFSAAYALQSYPAAVAALVAVGILVILGGGGVLVYFAARDPDRLHTEEHLTFQRQLDVLAAKAGRMAVTAADVTAIGNPQAPALPSGPEGVGDE